MHGSQVWESTSDRHTDPKQIRHPYNSQSPKRRQKSARSIKYRLRALLNEILNCIAQYVTYASLSDINIALTDPSILLTWPTAVAKANAINGTPPIFAPSLLTLFKLQYTLLKASALDVKVILKPAAATGPGPTPPLSRNILVPDAILKGKCTYQQQQNRDISKYRSELLSGF